MTAGTHFSRVIIIFNPNSTGNAPAIAKKLMRSITTAFPKMKVELQATKHAGHARELAYMMAGRYAKPLIVSVSGDGGYHEVINGTLAAIQNGTAREPTVTVVGAGNANDHYRATHRKSVVKLISQVEPRPIDLLKLTIERPRGTQTIFAHSYAGLGVSPIVAQELNKYKLNLFKEIYIIGKTMFSLRPVTILHDQRTRKVDSLIFANIHEMAKVLTLHTGTNLHDGKFEVIEISHRNLLSFVFIIIRAAVWSLGRQRQYTSYAFTLLETAPLQIDGEVIKCNDGDSIRVTVAKDAIKALY